MTFSVITPLLATTLNLNLFTDSVRLQCAAFSFPGFAWILLPWNCLVLAAALLPLHRSIHFPQLHLQLSLRSSLEHSRFSSRFQQQLQNEAALRSITAPAPTAIRSSHEEQQLQFAAPDFWVGGFILRASRPAGRFQTSHLRLRKFAHSTLQFSGPRTFFQTGQFQLFLTPLHSSHSLLHYVKIFFFFFDQHFLIFFPIWLKIMAEISQRLQQVSTIATRKRVITWMVQDESIHGVPGVSGLYNRTIHAFPEHFRGQRSSNLMRASRWWALRHQYCNEEKEPHELPPISCSRSRSGRQKQLRTKAAPGRGHKCSEWVQWLYPTLT